MSHLEVLDILYHWNLTWPFKADIAVHTTKWCPEFGKNKGGGGYKLVVYAIMLRGQIEMIEDVQHL